MSGFRPVNASKLRQSLSAETPDDHSENNSLQRRRRVSLPYRKATDPGLSDDDEDEDDEDSDEEARPSINKSVLRASTGNQGLKSALPAEKPPASKRQRTTSNGEYVNTEVNGTSTRSKPDPSLVITFKYRSHRAIHNPSPAYRDTEVYVSGTGWIGQLGVPVRKTHKGVPIRVDDFDPLDGFSIAQIACGPTHCAALSSEGSIITWGSNVLGALGRPTGRPEPEGSWEYSLEQMYVRESENIQANKDPQIDFESIPDEINMSVFFENTSIVQVAVGCHKTFVLTSDGYVYAWGAFVRQFKWDGKEVTAELTVHAEPTLIIGLQNIVSIAAGNDFLLALDNQNDVHRLGVFSFDAQVGHIDWFKTRPWSEKMEALAYRTFGGKRPPNLPRIVQIYASPMTAFAVSQKGEVFGWGDNGSNKLALPKENVASQPTPVKIAGLPNDVKIKHVVGNSRLTLAIMEDGSAFIWGSLEAAFPQATPSTLPPDIKIREEDKEAPALVIYEPAKLPFDDISSAAVGDEHIIVVTTKGEVYAWGSNKSGQCGLGWSRQSLSTPYELRIKYLDGRPVDWVAAAHTWTFFGAAIDGAGREVVKLKPRSEDAMDLD